MSSTNILATRKGRFISFAALYITEGIPLGFIATAMGTYLRGEGVDAAQIGALIGMLYLPWAFKWAWAPLVDLMPLKRFGGKKAWIMGTQSMMVLTLMSFAFIDITTALPLVITLTLIHNLFGSMNDVAIDGLAVSTLPKDELGRANGFMFGGAYFGQALGGSGALFISSQFGFMATYPYIAALLVIVMLLVTRRIQDPLCQEADEATEESVVSQFIEQIKGFGKELYSGFFKSGRGPVVGVAFALLPAGAVALGSVTGTTLQVDLGMSQGQIAELAMYSAILSAFGCIAGGWMGDKVGQRLTIGIWYACSALPILYLDWLLKDQTGVGNLTISDYYPIALAVSLITGLHYGVGAAIFMGLTNPLVAATQFTAFMALKNVAHSYTNFWQGSWVEQYGYSLVFTIDGLVVMLPIVLLLFLAPRKVHGEGEVMKGPMPEAS